MRGKFELFLQDYELYDKKPHLWFFMVSKVTYQFESKPVRLKSAHNFNRFLIELSECEGNARLISSILILRGLSRDFQNNL